MHRRTRALCKGLVGSRKGWNKGHMRVFRDAHTSLIPGTSLMQFGMGGDERARSPSEVEGLGGLAAGGQAGTAESDGDGKTASALKDRRAPSATVKSARSWSKRGAAIATHIAVSGVLRRVRPAPRRISAVCTRSQTRAHTGASYRHSPQRKCVQNRPGRSACSRQVCQ